MTIDTAPDTGLKIIELQAENFKRLKAVTIRPDGTLQVIAGRNAQGKTSVLDAIMWACQYAGAKKTITNPVRDGEDTARVMLDLGDFRIERTEHADGRRELAVTSPEGAKYSSPQKMLDGLIGALSFDPLAFANAPDKERLATLLSLVDLPFDVDDMKRRRDELFEARADINRRVKALEGQIGGMRVPPPGTPDVEQSSADVIAELRAAQDANRDRELAEAELVTVAATITRLQAELLAAIDQQTHLQGFLADAPPAVDLSTIEARLAGLEATNALVRDGKARAEAVTRRDELAAEAAALTAAMQAMDTEKADALAAADLPLPGLGFDDTGVTYQGQPFSQASGAEQLRVSLAIAMALNPGLRVLRIVDGSLLDSANMTLIEDMATAGGFQVWVERVDESGTVGVVIADGEVAA